MTMNTNTPSWHKKHKKKLAKDKQRHKYHNVSTRAVSYVKENKKEKIEAQQRNNEAATQDYKSLPLWQRIWYRLRYHKLTQKLIARFTPKWVKRRKLNEFRKTAQDTTEKDKG